LRRASGADVFRAWPLRYQLSSPRRQRTLSSLRGRPDEGPPTPTPAGDPPTGPKIPRPRGRVKTSPGKAEQDAPNAVPPKNLEDTPNCQRTSRPDRMGRPAISRPMRRKSRSRRSIPVPPRSWSRSQRWVHRNPPRAATSASRSALRVARSPLWTTGTSRHERVKIEREKGSELEAI
jgi:hypothetical protein